MKVWLIGAGSGDLADFTQRGLQALANVECLIGSLRLLEQAKQARLATDAPTLALISAKEILQALERVQSQGAKSAAVLFSGDTGFYSGATSLLEALNNCEDPFEIEVVPGISSLQLFAGRIKQPWQDWNLVSAHGVACDPVAAVMEGKPTFFLTGTNASVQTICQELDKAGLGKVRAVGASHLGLPDEILRDATVADLAACAWDTLSVLWVEQVSVPPRRIPGWPDDAFIRSNVPMTKQFVRSAIFSLLNLASDEIFWDIGAGTGSVSVEASALCRQVWAVECDPNASDLIRANKAQFNCWNLRLVEAEAPSGLDGLPNPDAVFLGGTRGNMKEILEKVYEKSPYARVAMTAVSLDTLAKARDLLREFGMEPSVVQISVSREQLRGNTELLLAENPVFIIAAQPLQGALK